jgi:hypothetical protein
MRAKSIKDLGAGGTTNIATVGKESICGNFLAETRSVKGRKAGLDMALQGVAVI